MVVLLKVKVNLKLNQRRSEPFLQAKLQPLQADIDLQFSASFLCRWPSASDQHTADCTLSSPTSSRPNIALKNRDSSTSRRQNCRAGFF